MDHNFENLIGYNFNEISRKITASTNKALQKIGITFPQYRVISRLWLKGELTQTDLCNLLGISAATLTGIIQILENKKLITRKTDDSDKRAKKIAITAQGIEMRNAAFKIILESENELIDILPEEESKLLLKWIKIVNSKLK